MNINFKHDDYLSKDEAVKFLANYDLRQPEPKRSAEDRVRQLINSHVKKGHLPEAKNSKFEFSSLIFWAKSQKCFSGKLDELSGIYIHVSTGGVKLDGSAVTVYQRSLSYDIHECHVEIRRLDVKVSELESEVKLLKSQITSKLIQSVRNRKNGSGLA
jgi:hypothetical protein